MEINGVGLECDTWAQRLCLFSVCLRNVTKCVCTDKNDKSLGNPPILYLWDLRVSAGSFYHCFSQICQAMHAPSTFLMELTHPLYLSRAFIEIKQTNKQALLWPLYLFRSLPHNFSNAPLSIPCHTWLNSPLPHKPFSKKNIYFIFFSGHTLCGVLKHLCIMPSSIKVRMLYCLYVLLLAVVHIPIPVEHVRMY